MQPDASSTPTIPATSPSPTPPVTLNRIAHFKVPFLVWTILLILVGWLFGMFIIKSFIYKETLVTIPVPNFALNPTPRPNHIAGWEVFTSPKHYTISYETPLVFDAQIQSAEDILTYSYTNQGKTIPAFTLTITYPAQLPKSTTGEQEKVATYKASIIQEGEITHYYIVQNENTFKLSRAFLPGVDRAAAERMAKQVLSSFTISSGL